MSRVWRLVAILAGGVTGGVAGVAAQSPSLPPGVPAAYAPPEGMCRVWLKDVPAVQQPAPTDCQSAVRSRPAGATVIYGPEPRRSSFSPSDWSRPTVRQARDDDRSRTPFRSGGEGCADSNRDGVCDDLAGAEGCTDPREPCEAAPPLPSMRAAVQWIEGQRPTDMQRWFGSQTVSARFAMPPRGGAPDRVQWFDADGHIVQIWTDRNGDGRADRIEVFNRDGARIRVVGQ